MKQIVLNPISGSLREDLQTLIEPYIEDGFMTEFKVTNVDVTKNKAKISFVIRQRTKKDIKTDVLVKKVKATMKFPRKV